MKLVISRKNHGVHRAVSNDDLVNTINNGFGNTFRAVNDADVEAYVTEQATRGFVCYVFDHESIYQGQTTVIKSEAA